MRVVRHCSICEHLMNIFLGKKGQVPKTIGYFGEFSLEAFPELKDVPKIEREYWECSICFLK